MAIGNVKEERLEDLERKIKQRDEIVKEFRETVEQNRKKSV